MYRTLVSASNIRRMIHMAFLDQISKNLAGYGKEAATKSKPIVIKLYIVKYLRI